MHPSAAHNYNLEETVQLSNEAVQILHSIVRRAQEEIDLGTRTFDALFSAYEAVFAENGLDTNQDRICFRFLLRLGQPNGAGQRLYDFFEQLLAEQDIVLEFEDDLPRNDVEETRSDSGTDRLQDELGRDVGETAPSRRASFTSIYDATKELARVSAPRSSSRSSLSRLGLEESKAIYSNERHDRIGPKSSSQGFQRSWPNAGVSRNLLRRPEGRDAQKPARRSTSVQKGRFVLQHMLQAKSEAKPIRLRTHSQETRLTKTEMVNAANIFNEMRLQGFLHLILHQWRAMTQNVRSKNATMQQLALIRDGRTLSRQAFDIWRTTAQDRQIQQIQSETERFSERLYSRAGKARDLYLMAKAFSHWRVLSAEEAARTGVARRHMLRMKYFNAWKDITVINELKAQRQGLKRPFNILRKQLARICTNEVNAISVYHHNLTRFVFFRWFWGFCEAAVPRYRLSQVQARTYQTWVERTKQIAHQERQADLHFIRRNLQKIITKWATATRIDIGGYHQADAFRNGRLLRPLIQRWKAEAKLQSLAVGLSNIRDWRIARSNFSTVVTQSRMTQRALEVERLRLKRNAWTAWNDQLRVQAIQSQIKARIYAQAVYRWVLQERHILMIRVHEQNTKQRALRTFLKNARARSSTLTQQESIFGRNQRIRTLSSAMECWKLQINLLREKKIMAKEFWAPRLEQDALSAWTSELRTLHKHNDWAVDAFFYFSTTKVLLRWKVATQESQKKRRQAAYGTVRKLVKVNLAKKVLSNWHDKLQHLDSLQRESQMVADSQFREKIAMVFTVWKATTTQRVEDCLQASTRNSNRFLRGPLATWQDKSHRYRTLAGRAEHFRYIHISEICSSQLRKFSLKAFELRCREQAADAAKVRRFDRHLRQMFRHWNDRTQLNMVQDMTEPNTLFDSALPAEGPSVQERPPITLDRPAYLTRSEMNIRQSEEWTAFDDTLNYGNNTTNNDNTNEDHWIPPLNEPLNATASSIPAATPGYLNTPSKRAARAKALANLSTTPVGTPLFRTPFAARLRAERDVSTTPGTMGRERSTRKVTFFEDSNQ